MIILNNSDLVPTISDPNIRQLVQRRFVQLGEEGNCLIVIEPNDSIAEIDQVLGHPVLHNLLNDIPFGHPDYSPSYEVLEDHGQCYEMVFIFCDDGGGVALFIPKDKGVNSCLLRLCEENAVASNEW